MEQKTKFKQTEIGMIPEEWEIDGIETIYNISSGLSKPREEFGSGFPFVSFMDIFSNFSLPKNLSQLVNSSERERKACSVRRGDVFLTRTSETQEELGMSSVALKNYESATFNGFSKRLRPRNDGRIFPEFAAYLFRSRIIRNQILAFSSLTTRASLNAESIRRIKLILPPLPEQRAITKILSDLDSKIELNQRMNQTLESIAQALFKRWFVDFEFPDEKGRPYKSNGGKMKQTELGKIPDDWNFSVLPELTSIVDCLHTKKPEKLDSGKILLQFYNLTPNHDLDMSNPYYVSESDYNQWTKNICVRDGDILFTNAGRQAIAKVPYWFKGGMGRNITAVRAEKIDASYLFYYFLSSHGEKQITKNLDEGTIFSSLNVKGIRKIIILVPPKELQNSFYNIASKIRCTTEINNIENQKLSQIRDSLLPKLMSGQIRVR